jgi:DMATS type aromatic prenyltransferase
MTKFEAIATELKLIESTDLLSTHRQIDRSAQAGFNPEELVPKLTYVEAGIEKLTALCHAVGLKDKTAQAIEIFRAMTSSWGDRKIGDNSSWHSDVSDDFSPFEFSIAFKENRAELRILLEAQGAEPNLQSNWEAGLKLNQYLAERYNVSLDRFRQIEDLFVPTNPDAKFTIWHAVCFYPDKEPEFKLYLNPQSQHNHRAAAVVEDSLVRLGFPHAWIGLAEIAAQRGPDQDNFVYFSLDLSSPAQARVKVYLRHYDATVADLEKALSLADNYVAGDATEFCQALTPQQELFTSKPIVSCFSFIEGNKDRPSSGTLYVPIGHYTSSDLVVSDRIHQYFIQHSLSSTTYNRALQAFAIRPLNSGCGMHSHISIQRKQQQSWVTVYLNPEVYTVRQNSLEADKILAKNTSRSIEATAWHYETNSIADHPFLQRLQREPVNLTHLWLLFANGREGIVANFTRRLASVIGRIDHEHICCILTKQLNEELGNGDISKVHRELFDRLILALEPHKPQFVTAEMLAPGDELSQRLESLYADPNPYIGVGAAIVMEIRGKQIDEVMSKEFRTRTNVDRSSLLWLNLHEELEIGHAEEALELASIVGKGDGDNHAGQKGAEMTANALWNFFNGMYRLCFM